MNNWFGLETHPFDVYLTGDVPAKATSKNLRPTYDKFNKLDEEGLQALLDQVFKAGYEQCEIDHCES